MMPAPAVFKDDRLDFTPRLPPALRTNRLSVFYATVRPGAAAADATAVGRSNGYAVELGVADVRLGAAQWTWNDLLASDRMSTTADLRPGRVEHILTLGPERLASRMPTETAREFVRLIDAQLDRANNKELVLYVHGYRVTFRDVAVTMAGFAHYLGHGATAFFRWPTGVNFWDYSDCTGAERYIGEIEDVIALLAQSRAEYINVIAYSCGSPLLARALAQLRARHPQEHGAALARRYRLGNVIFAASDIDFKTFARDYVPPIMELAQQTILYMSRNDRALWFSSLIAGASRLGSPKVDELTRDELERLAANPRLQGIDVSDVRGVHEVSGGSRGHGYWYANEWISTDVTLSLRHPIPPQDRCLVRAPGRNVWRFPENYPECVANRLLARFPDLRRDGPHAERAAQDPPAQIEKRSGLKPDPQKEIQ